MLAIYKHKLEDTKVERTKLPGQLGRPGAAPWVHPLLRAGRAGLQVPSQLLDSPSLTQNPSELSSQALALGNH